MGPRAVHVRQRPRGLRRWFADPSLAPATVEGFDAPVAYGGIDGLGRRDGELYAGRNHQLPVLTQDGGAGSATPAGGAVDGPTTFDPDAHSDLGLVERQLGALSNGADRTHGVAPLRVVKVAR